MSFQQPSTPARGSSSKNVAPFLSTTASTTSQNGSGSDRTNSSSFLSCFKEKRTLTLRLFFVGSMLVAGAIFGTIAYWITSRLEEDVAIQTYESIASSALIAAKQIAIRKHDAAESLATVIGYAFPNASQWPFVGLRGYTHMATKIGTLSSSAGHGFMAIVKPNEVDEFELHAKELYEQFVYPNISGYSDFGFGIYDTNPSISNFTDGRYHDNTGMTTYGSPNQIMVPFLQHKNTFRNPSLLLRNMHAKALRGRVLDSIIACADAADPIIPRIGEGEESQSPRCSVVTDFTEIFVRPGPSAVIFHPIYPADDPKIVVGFVGTSVNWEEVLTNVVPDLVDGLHCIITSPTESYTYVIEGGVPKLLSSGDLHDRTYTHFGHSVSLLDDINTGASASAGYTLTVYPSQAMFDEFSTTIPLFVSFGFVTVIAICTGIFFVYDNMMKYESHQRKRILELKRRFVRFISHEIRTPLNVVCMGLELLQAEIRDSMIVVNDDPKQKVMDNNIPPPPTTTTTTDAPSTEMDKNKLGQEEGGGDTTTTTAITNSSHKEEQEDGSFPHWLGLTGDILESAQNAVSVLNDLLNYDKIESGTFQIEVEPVNLLRLVKKTVSEFSIQAKNRKIHYELLVQQDNMSTPTSALEEAEKGGGGSGISDQRQFIVLGDEVRLAQVIRNLISNALKFSPEQGRITVLVMFTPSNLPTDGGGGGVPVEPGATGKGESTSLPRAGVVKVRVTDNGVGLTKDQLGQLFREGVQFDANKLQSGGGSGLGLFITKEIVEKHGGSIEARSEGRGHGTVFEVELPLHQRNEESTDKKVQMGSDTGETETSNQSLEFVHRSHHVLVVDDVISNTKMLVRLLERAGHTCKVAHDGEEAIAAFVDNRNAIEIDPDQLAFDTILMDFEMPKLNGPAATKRLREMDCKAAIFGVTGNVLAEDVAFFKSRGADNVLPKPVNLSAVQACWASLKSPRG